MRNIWMAMALLLSLGCASTEDTAHRDCFEGQIAEAPDNAYNIEVIGLPSDSECYIVGVSLEGQIATVVFIDYAPDGFACPVRGAR